METTLKATIILTAAILFHIFINDVVLRKMNRSTKELRKLNKITNKLPMTNPHDRIKLYKEIIEELEEETFKYHNDKAVEIKEIIESILKLEEEMFKKPKNKNK